MTLEGISEENLQNVANALPLIDTLQAGSTLPGRRKGQQRSLPTRWAASFIVSGNIAIASYATASRSQLPVVFSTAKALGSGTSALMK
jgi:hypothetical protein